MNLKYAYDEWKNYSTAKYIQWNSIYITYSKVRKKIKKVVSSRDLEGGWQALLGKFMRELSEITVT